MADLWQELPPEVRADMLRLAGRAIAKLAILKRRGLDRVTDNELFALAAVASALGVPMVDWREDDTQRTGDTTP